jgi:hypothetical protein
MKWRGELRGTTPPLVCPDGAGPYGARDSIALMSLTRVGKRESTSKVPQRRRRLASFRRDENEQGSVLREDERDRARTRQSHATCESRAPSQSWAERSNSLSAASRCDRRPDCSIDFAVEPPNARLQRSTDHRTVQMPESDVGSYLSDSFLNYPSVQAVYASVSSIARQTQAGLTEDGAQARDNSGNLA